MPVGTRATVTGMTTDEMQALGAEIVLANTYHLLLRPGPELFRRVGGIHPFMGWDRPVLTDSGGYQIFSLSADRTIREEGASFAATSTSATTCCRPKIDRDADGDWLGHHDGPRWCVDSTAPESVTRAAMERTHRWALRSLAARTNPAQALFGIVQGRGAGAASRVRRLPLPAAIRRAGHRRLAVGDTRAQREDTTAFAAELLPADRPRYLMGVGTPPDLLVAIGCGVDMFDCILPTHLASQGTAFTGTGRVRVTRSAYNTCDEPLDASCTCMVCRKHSRAYLGHLIRCREPLGPRLISRHNFHHYLTLMRDARQAIEDGVYASWAKNKLAQIDRHEHAAPGRLRPAR